MNPITWLYAALAAIVLAIGAFFAGDFHGREMNAAKVETKQDKATITALQTVNITEGNQRANNETSGASYAASAASIAVASNSIDTRLRVRTCPRIYLPEAAASRPAIDGTGTTGDGPDTSTIDLDDTAGQIVKLGAERDRLAAKVSELQKTIQDQPGYTQGN